MKVSRREFVRVSALAAAGTVAAACSQPTATPAPVATTAPTTAPTVAATATTAAAVPPTAVPEPTTVLSLYNEAPALAELVASGALPPVEDRLPVNPLILQVLEETGQYGGIIRRGFKGVSDGTGPWKMVVQFMVFYTYDLALRPNIAESWESNEDASEWTFHLREGMNWSDGTPYTADAFTWWWEYRQNNKDIQTSPSVWMTTGSEKTPAVLTAPDDYTVVFSFADPNPLFIYQIAQYECGLPGHYLAQYHMDLTDDQDALQAMVTEKGYETWVDVFTEKETFRLNNECPTIYAWTGTDTTLQDEIFILERNPYFWQVDVDGNQLPYIDKLQHRLFETTDVFNMWILNGEIDFQARHVSVADWVLLKESEAAGGYKVHYAADDATWTLFPNQTTPDPDVRAFLDDKNVRKALSYAMNREEINELVFDGLYTPRQFSPPSASPQYYEPLTNAYIEYDPDMANQLLDEAGYTAKDAEGYRLTLDGSKTLSFVIESSDTGHDDEMEMMTTYLTAVGVKCSYNIPERSLVEEHCSSNQIQIRYTLASRAMLPLVDPAFFLGLAIDKCFGAAWKLWYDDPTGPLAEEPPADGFAKEMWALWEEIKVEPEAAQQTAKFLDILDIAREELPYIGIVGVGPAPIIVRNGLRNLPIDYHMPYSNPIIHDGFVPLATYWWEE